jgi:hypothetical protein
MLRRDAYRAGSRFRGLKSLSAMCDAVFVMTEKAKL